MKRILILSDSVALARLTPERVDVEKTWPYLLKSRFDICQVSLGGATIYDLYKQVNYHIPYKPDLVIVQVGIVDCSPRFMTRFEMEVVKRIPLVNNYIFSLLNRPGVRKFRRVTYTSLRDFEKYSQKVKAAFPGAQIFSLGIIEASQVYEAKLPGITEQISRYNNLLKKVFGSDYISLSGFPQDGVMSDHHHVNEAGHHFIYQRILDFFKTRSIEQI